MLTYRPDPPRTIDDAGLLGWEGLQVECDHGATIIWWQMLRRMTRYRRLDEIAERLVRRECRCKPRRVLLYGQFAQTALTTPQPKTAGLNERVALPVLVR
jgi:hypothetical protein